MLYKESAMLWLFALCALIALYCPDKLNWSEIAGIAGNVSETSTDNNSNNQSMADSLYNIQLVQRFCRDSLPFNFCHLSIEDVVYLHDSIRSNMTCFLADLFTGLEIRPVCSFVQRPGIKKERVIQVPDPDFHPIKSPVGLKRLSSNSNERSGK
jgi:calmodulin-regulated spectrin-associated protein